MLSTVCSKAESLGGVPLKLTVGEVTGVPLTQVLQAGKCEKLQFLILGGCLRFGFV